MAFTRRYVCVTMEMKWRTKVSLSSDEIASGIYRVHVQLPHLLIWHLICKANPARTQLGCTDCDL